MGQQFSYSPAQLLLAELGARQWTQAEFAEIVGRPAQFISEIMAGKKEITRESAEQIGAALSFSAELLLNLQNEYLLQQQRQDPATQRTLDTVRQRARLNTWAPIAILRKRGFVTSTDLDVVEREIKQLFEVNDLEQSPSSALRLAARRTNNEASLSPLQLGWVAVARSRARELEVAPLDLNALRTVASTLTTRAVDPAAVANFPDLFARVGVRLVYVEAFPGSKMDGASFLLDEDSNKPVIAISGRGKRLDKVLFTLLHEIAHVVNQDVRAEALIHDESDALTLGDEEAANKLASSWQIPGGLPQPPTAIRRGWIDAAASKTGVHPIVIIGRLQNDRRIDWRTPLVKGAPNVEAQLQAW